MFYRLASVFVAREDIGSLTIVGSYELGGNDEIAIGLRDSDEFQNLRKAAVALLNSQSI